MTADCDDKIYSISYASTSVADPTACITSPLSPLLSFNGEYCDFSTSTPRLKGVLHADRNDCTSAAPLPYDHAADGTTCNANAQGLFSKFSCFTAAQVAAAAGLGSGCGSSDFGPPGSGKCYHQISVPVAPLNFATCRAMCQRCAPHTVTNASGTPRCQPHYQPRFLPPRDCTASPLVVIPYVLRRQPRRLGCRQSALVEDSTTSRTPTERNLRVGGSAPLA